jgi:hypothetical protein
MKTEACGRSGLIYEPIAGKLLIENKPSSHHQIDNNEVNNGAINGRTNIDLQNILINITSSPAIDRATMSMKRSTARAATWLVSSERIHNIRLVRGRYSPANSLAFAQTLHLP